MSKPVVRTYGKSKPTASSSSNPSLLFDLTPPSSPLITPHASSDLDHIDAIPYIEEYQNEGKENVSPNKARSKTIPTQSTLSDFFGIPSKKVFGNETHAGPSKKRPLQPLDTKNSKRTKDDNALRQMHLTHLPLLHTCQECQMSYVRGGDDEGTHEKHHARVTRGIIWDGLGRGKARGNKRVEGGTGDNGWRVVRDNVPFGPGGKGKGKGTIIMVDGSYGGSRLDDILKTVDTVLSSPPLIPAILDRCKIFLYTTSSPAPISGRLKRSAPSERTPKERIVAVVVAQGIKWAMRVLTPDEKMNKGQAKGQVVDSGEGVLCDSTPLPTPLGIHRLFTIPSYRSLGLAKLLLDAACEHTTYGCTFDPAKGQVAFSQPTNSGRITMEKWGKGMVRVFVDDESQL